MSFKDRGRRIAVLGAGLAGCITALALARKGHDVDLIDESATPVSGASLHNEGKLHLGYVYAADNTSRTCQRMIEGSLSFLPILERFTRVPMANFARSHPFLYGVPAASQKSPDEIATYFEQVDATICDFRGREEMDCVVCATTPHRPLTAAEMSRWFNPDLISAAFVTDEFSVDTIEIADLVGACVYSEPRVVLRLGTTVTTAEAAPCGNWDILCSTSSGLERSRYAAVVNALWADRLRLDCEIGLHPGRNWLLRYKAALTLEVTDLEKTVDIPTATLISGPYGDVVNHGNRRFYLSWYPVCKLAETREADPRSLLAIAKSRDAGKIASASLDALVRYLPTLIHLTPLLGRMRVGGGVIAAWGETDIDNPASGLHERHEIGPLRRGSWVTLDTGKYCTAPLNAVRAADLVIEALA